MRQLIAISLATGLLGGCASDLTEREGYPSLSDVKDRPTVALTPERSEELVEILETERQAAQAFANLGFREEQDIDAIRAARRQREPQTPPSMVQPSPIEEAPAAEPAAVTEPAPDAVPLATLQQQAEERRQPPPAEPMAVSDEALANSQQLEELLAKDPEFK